MATHRLNATPETVRLGMFDASFPPVLTIRSGDIVEIECLSGYEAMMPADTDRFKIPDQLLKIHAAHLPRLGPHILTGPLEIEDAVPGDVLEVRIGEIRPNNDWGFTLSSPHSGTIPEDFPCKYLSHIAVDPVARSCKPDWGPTLMLAPFFGVMGVAPSAELGCLSSREPGAHGGNLDNRELGTGSRLYLPVWTKGALFSVGDGHGLQGDGEVCLTALELGLTGILTFYLHKVGKSPFPLSAYPRAETTDHYISMGLHEDLDEALKIALREMLALLLHNTTLMPEQAYQLCSLAVDFRGTQSVNGKKGIHALLKKSVFADHVFSFYPVP